MSDDRMARLEQRLAIAERDAEVMREQLRVMVEHRQSVPRARRGGIVGLLTAPLLLMAAGQPMNTEAQVPRSPAAATSPEVLTVKAPFQVVDAGGRVVMKVEVNDGRPRLTVGDPASGGSALGVGASGAGFAVVRTATGTDGVALGAYRGEPIGVRVIGPDGKNVEGALALSKIDQGSLTLGMPDKGGMQLGTGKSGTGFMVLRRQSGEPGISMGLLDGRPLAVSIFGENAKELVTLETSQKGGSMKVSTSAGVPVAAVFAGEDGRGIALTGAAGGSSAVSLRVEPEGGRVRVFAKGGGSTRAELFAGKSGGEVNVYNRSGEAVIWLEGTSQDQGRLQVGRAGNVYVDAGVLQSGVGIVVAGPQVGGPPSGLVAPNFIQGRTGSK